MYAFSVQSVVCGNLIGRPSIPVVVTVQGKLCDNKIYMRPAQSSVYMYYILKSIM